MNSFNMRTYLPYFIGDTDLNAELSLPFPACSFVEDECKMKANSFARGAKKKYFCHDSPCYDSKTWKCSRLEDCTSNLTVSPLGLMEFLSVRNASRS
jgi:hypothetical protein